MNTYKKAVLGTVISLAAIVGGQKITSVSDQMPLPESELVEKPTATYSFATKPSNFEFVQGVYDTTLNYVERTYPEFEHSFRTKDIGCYPHSGQRKGVMIANVTGPTRKVEEFQRFAEKDIPVKLETSVIHYQLE